MATRDCSSRFFSFASRSIIYISRGLQLVLLSCDIWIVTRHGRGQIYRIETKCSTQLIAQRHHDARGDSEKKSYKHSIRKWKIKAE